MISGGYDGVLRWHNLQTGAAIREVTAHRFWSWDMAVSANGSRVASVTGRYEVGGYKYEPAPETEPSVKVFETATGRLIRELPHTPHSSGGTVGRRTPRRRGKPNGGGAGVDRG